ncbi:acyltransferase [Dubosiella newyorkensis]|nr:acyltransferase [Dubosiella newyorkensis]
MDREVNELDFINIVSTIGVVFLHVNNCFWSFSSTERYWATANVIESVFYFAVPLFFMLCGVTLIDYRYKYSTRDYIKKRFIKVFIPYIFWSIIGIIWTHLIFSTNQGVFKISLKEFINLLLSGNGIRYFWFFIPLFMIYISIPFIAFLEQDKKLTVFKIYILFYIVMNAALPFFNNVFQLGLNLTQWRIPILEGFMVYPLLGYVINNIQLTKRFRHIIYFIGLFSLILIIFGTYYESIKINAINEIFKGYLNLPCILYSLSMFCFLREIFPKIKNNKMVYLFIKWLRPYTFSIFLIHFFFLDSIERFLSIDQRSIIYRLIGPFVVIILSVCFAYIIRLFKYGKFILPK